MSEELKDFLEVLNEYARGGMSGLFPSEELVEELLNYICRLEKRLEQTTKFVNKLSSVGRGCEIYADVKRDILTNLKGSNL